MKHFLQILKHAFFPMALILSIILGALVGVIFKDQAFALKPFGDVFLNLMFTIVVPLVFFSIASAIANMSDLKKLWTLMANMMGAFLLMGIIAAVFMIIVVSVFPPQPSVFFHFSSVTHVQKLNLMGQIVNVFTVSDFIKLFSRDNMLALIFFAVLVGLATSLSKEKGQLVAAFLKGGTDISMKMITFIMYYAPIGFFCYFAVLVAELGPKLLSDYFHAILIYYVAGIFYFFFAYTLYAYLSDSKRGISAFWKNNYLPAITSVATCSSAASIPVNLQAADKIGVPVAIYETVIPLGTVLHKEGSVLGAIMKIAFLYGVFHLSFSGVMVLSAAVLVALLANTVISAIPSGGMIAEVLILSLYGFPPDMLIVIAAITLLIDPLATLLNVMGNTVCSMVVARLVEGKNWLRNPL